MLLQVLLDISNASGDYARKLLDCGIFSGVIFGGMSDGILQAGADLLAGEPCMDQR